MMDVLRRSKIDLVPQLLMKIYEFTRIREWYAKAGDIQAVANLEKLVMWARDQMNAGALTLQQFADRLQLAILTGEEMEEADIDEEKQEKKDAVILSTIHASKGLEYPIVIIPEMQRPLVSDFNAPLFFDIEGFGLDILPPSCNSRSSQFEEWMKQHKYSLLEEEARVLYVAVTRAENAVCFIGSGMKEITKSMKYWSWKDEVLPCFDRMPSSLGQVRSS
jgi:DNA helicase-2/ATP-dependent DNA helicase PcrA